MTDIEQKAQAMVVEVLKERGIPGFCIVNRQTGMVEEALCRAIEQHEATKQEFDDFKQEVSDTIQARLAKDGAIVRNYLDQFIIPAPKPDPLVAALEGVTFDHYPPNDAKTIRAALDARGLEIREKGQ